MMFGSFLPSLWSLNNHSLLGSRSRHCDAVKWNSGSVLVRLSRYTSFETGLSGIFCDEANGFDGYALRSLAQFIRDMLAAF